MVRTIEIVAKVALVTLLLASAGCVATVRGPYVAYDTNQCYWTWVDDGYGGYEQMYCWAPTRASYIAYYQGGVVVRRYPGWYRGQRTVVVAPRVRVVQPRGVVIVPRPRAPQVRVRVRTPTVRVRVR